MKRWVLLVLSLCLLLPALAESHELAVARIRLAETSPGIYTLEAKVQPTLEVPAPLLPSGLSLQSAACVRERSQYRVHRFVFSGRTLGPQDTVVLPWECDGGLVVASWVDQSETRQFIRGEGAGLELPIAALMGQRSSVLGTFMRYTSLGMHHIAQGWDHLAFVLCLCFLARGRKLVNLVTAFTVGHSITLAIAALGLARVPSAPLEASIALSIVFAAREAVVNGRASRHGASLALGFGLLHGLGFASALTEMQLPASELWVGLPAFNVGVEAGQLMFVLAVWVVGWVATRVSIPSVLGRPALARAMGALALVWTLERVLGFGA